MSELINNIRWWWGRVTCPHQWKFAGHMTAEGDRFLTKEYHWYWHLEKCDICDSVRNVMNDMHRPDECGYLHRAD